MSTPSPRVLWHFSEDPAIARFVPHVSATATEREALVWAVDEAHQPLFWFPRDCPRATFWAGPDTAAEDAAQFLRGAPRVHAIEWDWLERLQKAELYAYRFEAAPFTLHDATAGYWVARETVVPLSVEPVGDLLARHAEAGIELRLTANLWPLWDAVIGSTLAFSACRLRYARPR